MCVVVLLVLRLRLVVVSLSLGGRGSKVLLLIVRRSHLFFYAGGPGDRRPLIARNVRAQSAKNVPERACVSRVGARAQAGTGKDWAERYGTQKDVRIVGH